MLQSQHLWNIIDLLFGGKNVINLVDHHLASFTEFIENYIPTIIEENNQILIIREDKTIKCLFSNVQFGGSWYTDEEKQVHLLYPMLAHEKNLTYSMPLYVDIDVYFYNKDNRDEPELHEHLPKQFVASIPVMTGSKYCNRKHLKKSPFDNLVNTGFFIVKGNEKVLISQERMIDNMSFTQKLKNHKFSHEIEIRSNTRITKMSNAFKIMYSEKKNLLYVHFVNLSRSVPLLVLMRAMGAVTDKMIYMYIQPESQYEHILQDCLDELHKIKDIKAHINQNFTNKKISLEYIVKHRILPHIKGRENKLIFIGFMARKLFRFISNDKNVVDRDHLVNKKIETAGVLLGQLFEKLWKDTLASSKKQIIKQDNWYPVTDGTFFKFNLISTKTNTSLATGIWNSKISSEHKKYGIAQVLKRLNYSSTISHLRRINSPVNKTGKLIDPRKLHNSQFGYCCISETPEGQQTGLLKNLALSCFITSYVSPEIVTEFCKRSPLVSQITIHTKVKEVVIILLNGAIIGVTQDPWEFVDSLKSVRRSGQIPNTISITYKQRKREIIIFTDEGRLVRPLLIVKNGKINISNQLQQKLFNNQTTLIELLNNGVIEYVDPHESETILIAKNIKTLKESSYPQQFSHCEIHNCLIFGSIAALIPFSIHNQSPRVLYQCAQAKQAIGLNNLQILKRNDTTTHVMQYMQRPLVDTQISKKIGFTKYPAGSNVIVAIACHNAYNIEDSIVINKASVERGLFQVVTYFTYKTVLKKEASMASSEIMCNPTSEKGIVNKKNKYFYRNLASNGLVKVGSFVKKNDILIGKKTPVHAKCNQFRDTSVQMTHHTSAIVQKVEVTENLTNDQTIIKIKLRAMRKLEVGDKACSRHGQKGTVGKIIPETDMIVSESGFCPDLMINPHAFPSRMTIGQILEAALGKYGAISGTFIDATPFDDQYDVDTVGESLLSVGFCPSGKEVFYDGITGEKIENKIFVGPTYYQRLKHLVSDKIHARAEGPINLLTHQPKEGRSKDGGLKLGNMELDCIHAHSIANFLQEKFFLHSDKYYAWVCNNCKQIARVNEEQKMYICSICNQNSFSKIQLPISSKLLFYELMGMGIQVRIDTEK